jgi:small subunit ribosomal protein S4
MSRRFDARAPLKIGRFQIKDDHPQKRYLNIPETLVHSSNIVTARIADQLGAARMQAMFRRLGFDTRPDIELREKQRLRAQYGIREAQLKIQFEEARKTAGLTGENLVEQLEMRLDAIIVRSAIARTTAQARQMIVHRHILVDGQLVDRPSFRVKPGQLVHVKERSEGMEIFQVSAAGAHVDVLPKTPAYLEVEIDKLQARLVRRPKRAEVPITCEVQLVVEYYAAR